MEILAVLVDEGEIAGERWRGQRGERLGPGRPRRRRAVSHGRIVRGDEGAVTDSELAEDPDSARLEQLLQAPGCIMGRVVDPEAKGLRFRLGADRAGEA